jgi:hypothetical protein
VYSPIPVAALSETSVCGCSLPGDCGFESPLEHGCLSFVSVVCCQIEVSATGRSLVQGIPTDVVCLSVLLKYYL